MRQEEAGLTQRHGDAPAGQLGHHRRAVVQLWSQSHDGDVVQAAVDLRQLLHAAAAEGADELLLVGSILVDVDEGTLQVAPCNPKHQHKLTAVHQQ